MLHPVIKANIVSQIFTSNVVELTHDNINWVINKIETDISNQYVDHEFINRVLSKNSLYSYFMNYYHPNYILSSDICYCNSLEKFVRKSSIRGLRLYNMCRLYNQIDNLPNLIRDTIYFDTLDVLKFSATKITLEIFDKLSDNYSFKLMIIKKFLGNGFDNLQDFEKENFVSYMSEKYPEIKSFLMLI